MKYVVNESATTIRAEKEVCPMRGQTENETVKSIVDETNEYLRVINSRLYGINKFVFEADYSPDDNSDNKCLMDVLLENRNISRDVANKLYEFMNKLGV